MSRSLAVLLGGHRVGDLIQGQGGVLALRYDADYRSSAAALPLSLSLPLSRPDHVGAVVRSYCQGLLPDNENVLERWGREFQVSAGNPFALLSHVGEDCAGAAQSKYQSEGGPSPDQIIELIRRVVAPAAVAEQEVGRFVDALALNWLIAGTDAHAKNYSLLLRPGQVRLAPLYDVASSLPYDDMYLPRLRLAMKVGSEYRVEAITGRHWAVFAERNRLDAGRVRERIGELAGRLPEAFRQAANADAVVALGSELPGRLVARITEHAARCIEALARV